MVKVTGSGSVLFVVQCCSMCMADVVSLLSSERLKWAGQPVIFYHGKLGGNIELSQNNSVVTSKMRTGKVTHYNYGIAATREPVSVGVMLKVTVMKTNARWSGGLVSQSHSYHVTQVNPHVYS